MIATCEYCGSLIRGGKDNWWHVSNDEMRCQVRDEHGKYPFAIPKNRVAKATHRALRNLDTWILIGAG